MGPGHLSPSPRRVLSVALLCGLAQALGGCPAASPGEDSGLDLGAVDLVTADRLAAADRVVGQDQPQDGDMDRRLGRQKPRAAGRHPLHPPAGPAH